jgi:hypothetical protein
MGWKVNKLKMIRTGLSQGQWPMLVVSAAQEDEAGRFLELRSLVRYKRMHWELAIQMFSWHY